MARDLETAQAIVITVCDRLFGTELGELEVGTFELIMALGLAVEDVADLLDPAEKFDAEV